MTLSNFNIKHIFIFSLSQLPATERDPKDIAYPAGVRRWESCVAREGGTFVMSVILMWHL